MMNYYNFVIILCLMMVIILVNEIKFINAQNQPGSSNSESKSAITAKTGWNATTTLSLSGTFNKTKPMTVQKQSKSYAQIVAAPPKESDSKAKSSEGTLSKAAKRNLRRHESRKKQQAFAQEASTSMSPEAIMKAHEKFLEVTFSSEDIRFEPESSPASKTNDEKREESIRFKLDSSPTSKKNDKKRQEDLRFEPESSSASKKNGKKRQEDMRFAPESSPASEKSDEKKLFQPSQASADPPLVPQNEKVEDHRAGKQSNKVDSISQSSLKKSRSPNLAAANNSEYQLNKKEHSHEVKTLNAVHENPPSVEPIKVSESSLKNLRSSISPQMNFLMAQKEQMHNEENLENSSLRINSEDRTQMDTYQNPGIFNIKTPVSSKEIIGLSSPEIKQITIENENGNNRNLLGKVYKQAFSSLRVHTQGEENNINPADNVRASEKNVLLILCEIPGIDPFTMLDTSAINPNHFGATDVVKLLHSGLLVRCDSEAGATALQRIISSEFKELDVELTSFTSRIVCIHNVPKVTTDDQLHFTIVQKYRRMPYKIKFVPYKPGEVEGRQIALLDVSESLWNMMKASPSIKVRWNERKLYIISLTDQEKYEHFETISPPSPSQIKQQTFDVWINNLTNDINEEEISRNIIDKYGESPLKVQFVNDGKNEKIAIIFVLEELLIKIIISPKIQIRDSEKEICTSLPVHRCSKCHLLGHLGKSCSAEPRPPPEKEEMCLDCCEYNNNNYGNIESKQRDTNHETDDDKCPTRIMYFLNCLSDARNGNLEQKHSIPSLSRAPLDSPQYSLQSPSAESSSSFVSDRFREAVEQSVEQTLARVLPLLNKSVAEAVNKSLAKLKESTYNNNGKGKEKLFNEINRKAIFVTVRDSKMDTVEELGKLDINTENFVIDRAIIYPVSGNVLLICDSVEEADYLRHVIIQSPKLELLTWKGLAIKARIDSVPQRITTQKISYYIHQKYGEYPERIQFKSYRKPGRENFRIVILFISETLLEKIRYSPLIFMENQQFKIDITFWPNRCEKCHLIGHQIDTCLSKSELRPQIIGKCLDCCHYNQQMKTTKFRFKPRDENHATGLPFCPTKISYTTNQNYRYFN